MKGSISLLKLKIGKFVKSIYKKISNSYTKPLYNKKYKTQAGLLDILCLEIC